MTSKRILLVGHCGADTGALTGLLEGIGPCQCQSVASSQEALAVLQQSRPDLILINRVLDRTGESGLELLGSMADSSPELLSAAMIVSNYPDVQQRAVALGGRPGFGKSQLRQPQTVELLRSALTPAT